MRDGTLVAPRTGVPLLTGLGVSPSADLMFRAISAHGPQSATELSAALGMPADRVRSALDELAGSGIAAPARQPGGTSRRRDNRRWYVQPPDVAVNRLRRRQDEVARARHRVRRWLTDLSDLDTDPNQVMTARPLYGGARVRARLTELVGAIRHEHLSMHPEPSFSRSAVKAAAPLDQALAARRISVLTLGVPPDGRDASRPHTEEMTRQGILYRELPSLPTKLMVFDRRVAIVPLDPRDIAKGAIELATPTAVHDIVTWFLGRWDAAQPPRTPLVSMEFSPREQSIVSLLAAGHTDASAAASLGISVRTVAYAIRGLMDRYGVQNRFQLGLVLGAAHRRG
jgi:DNA-binding CsgD family transcriptional regulator